MVTIFGTIPLLVALLGLLLWVFPSGSQTVKDIGKILFAAGILVTLFALSGRTARLFG